MTNTWNPVHDKYGRPTVALRREGSARELAVVCTLPKACAPNRYLVNLRCLGMQWDDGRVAHDSYRVTYHASRSAAKAWAERQVAWLLDELPTNVAGWHELQVCAGVERVGRELALAQAAVSHLNRLGVESDSAARLAPQALLDELTEDYERLCAERIHRSLPVPVG